jgi:hypothetical protein
MSPVNIISHIVMWVLGLVVQLTVKPTVEPPIEQAGPLTPQLRQPQALVLGVAEAQSAVSW